MSRVGPGWFAADQIFEGSGGWYIGSRDGFSIGPYLSAGAARADVAELRRRLAIGGGAGVHDVLNVVRELLEGRQADVERGRRFGRMHPARAGEPPRLGYRSPRLFALYGRWYFLTREGIDVGPYPSKDHADQGQQRLVALLRGCASDEERRRAIVDFVAGGGAALP